MLGFLKTKTSPEELGSGLADWTDPSEESDALFLQELPGEVDRERFILELRYLRAFAIVFVIFQKFGDGPISDAIFRAYYGIIALKIELGSAITMSDIESRLGEYRQSLTQGGAQGAHFGVGKAFARLCGAEGELSVTMAGTFAFSGTCIELAEFLNKVRVS